MKAKLPMIARILLGLVFFVFGLNGFLNFIPPPPDMPEAGLNFFNAMVATGYLLYLVKGTEVVCGLMLLANFKAPLAVVMITPVVVNIFLFHIFVVPGIAMAAIIVALWGFLVYSYRAHYKGLC
ncbi:MAG: DoxX family membrane protein [Bacteriovoracia bacterium]